MVYPSNITLNLNTRYVLPIPTAQQGDTARVLTFNILDNGVPFSLVGKSVRAKIIKPDGTKVFNGLTITNATNGECNLALTNQVLAVVGIVKCQLEITEGQDILSTIIFNIEVRESIDVTGAVESSNEFTALQNGLTKLDEWDKYFHETSGAIEEKYTTRLNAVESSLEDMMRLNTENENVNLSEELLNETGWTSTGWTGDWQTGFTHTLGESTPIIKTLDFATGTKMYLVSMRLTPTCQLDGGNGTSDFTVTIGNSEPFVTYQGSADSKLYQFGIKSVTDGNLIITPEPRYEGVISEISVKEILGEIEGINVITDTNGSVAFEIRPGKANKKNIFIGKQVGKYNISGNQNVVVGDDCFTSNVSGYWNSVFGYLAMANNISGSRNVAGGYLALNKNISGDRNVAFGPFSLCRNTVGRNDIAIGADTLWMNINGCDNVAISLAALSENIDGNDNIGIGKGAGASNKHGSGIIAIGRSALTYLEGDDAVAIGRWSCFANTKHGNVGIGPYSQRFNESGFGNTSVGKNSLVNPIGGDYNTAVGEDSGASVKNGNATVSENTLIGFGTGKSLISGGNKNTLIGTLAGAGITSGEKNIMIGRATEPLNPTDNNKLNIGDFLYGDLLYRRLMVGTKREPTAILELKEGGGTPGTAPLKFNSGNLLSSPEAGTFEFKDGVLYFTGVAGQRKKVSLID